MRCEGPTASSHPTYWSGDRLLEECYDAIPVGVAQLQQVIMGLESERNTLRTALLTRETELAHANNRADALKEEVWLLHRSSRLLSFRTVADVVTDPAM
eukprot:25259-Eustigmatos_ZCMA.PRE.1